MKSKKITLPVIEKDGVLTVDAPTWWGRIDNGDGTWTVEVPDE